MFDELNLVTDGVEQNRIAVSVHLVRGAAPKRNALSNETSIGLVYARHLEEEINATRFGYGRAALQAKPAVAFATKDGDLTRRLLLYREAHHIDVPVANVRDVSDLQCHIR